eukprot:gnl/Dysnectes_brevis/1434_a1624_4081.p1 GENE.gnl/Dysnectes_brevis/1434_a1624_4081~~gnl/Dysnectes_brevis/1434_a1624_4081.p1  ORF type:complete len:312 (+),score=102.21 gnl/Dysnectes_brevis/1434_a1624_4081:40-975(+)
MSGSVITIVSLVVALVVFFVYLCVTTRIDTGEMGLIKDLNQNIDSRVYSEPGRYYRGLTKTMEIYPSTIKFVDPLSLTVNLDSSSVNIAYSFQYRLLASGLYWARLDAADVTKLESKVKSAVAGTLTALNQEPSITSVDDLFHNRIDVELIIKTNSTAKLVIPADVDTGPSENTPWAEIVFFQLQTIGFSDPDKETEKAQAQIQAIQTLIAQDWTPAIVASENEIKTLKSLYQANVTQIAGDAQGDALEIVGQGNADATLLQKDASVGQLQSLINTALTEAQSMEYLKLKTISNSKSKVVMGLTSKISTPP